MTTTQLLPLRILDPKQQQQRQKPQLQQHSFDNNIDNHDGRAKSSGNITSSFHRRNALGSCSNHQTDRPIRHCNRRSIIVLLTAVLMISIHLSTNLFMYLDIQIILSDTSIPGIIQKNDSTVSELRRINLRTSTNVATVDPTTKQYQLRHDRDKYNALYNNDTASNEYDEPSYMNETLTMKYPPSSNATTSGILSDPIPILDINIQRLGVLYSICRGDRSGSAILDMMYAHAYAFAYNVSYGGSCCLTNGLPRSSTVSLLRDLHWNGILPFACPKSVDPSQYNILHPNGTEVHPTILNSPVYRVIGERTMNTTAWRNHMRDALQRHQEIRKEIPVRQFVDDDGAISTNSEYFNIAVHVRRGDVTPCRYTQRYLPNAHYLSLIDHYISKTTDAVLNGREIKVTIYSESNSFESFDDYILRNYTLQLDDNNLADVWMALSTADVAILSRSTFSIVPALMNSNTVVATDFFGFDVYAMNDIWEYASKELLQNTTALIRHLIKTRCPQSRAVSNTTNLY